MALYMPSSKARLTLAVGLTIFITACSTGPKPSAMAMTPVAAQATTRSAVDINGEPQLASANPQTFISQGDIDPNAPDVYTVVKGDTLWDISGRFLVKPWLWPTIWDYNPQIVNPHLIYPGDVIALDYFNGRPTISISRDGRIVAGPLGVRTGAKPGYDAYGNPLDEDGYSVDKDGNVILDRSGRARLSPRMRAESLDSAIPLISTDSIAQFLVHPRVVPLKTIRSAPYLVANEKDSLASAIGDKIYARGKMNRNQTAYGVFRASKKLYDPVNGALLGHEVVHVGDAKLLHINDPSTLVIISSKMEAITGDILLPLNSEEVKHSYSTRLPELRGDARVVSLVNAISQTGRNQVVVLNVGNNSNIKQGDVLAIESRGRHIVDRRGRFNYEHVKLPNIRTGVVLVFKTFDRVSYALVMESTRPIKVNDIVTGI